MKPAGSEVEWSRVVLRPRDLWNVAGALTLLRLPLTLIFPFVASDPTMALVVFVLAELSDVVDGAVARRTGTVSETGAFVDGWLDKIFHVQAGWSLWLAGHIPAWWLLLWFARELLQVWTVPWYVRRYLRGEAPPVTSVALGKANTVALAVAFLATLLLGASSPAGGPRPGGGGRRGGWGGGGGGGAGPCIYGGCGDRLRRG